MFFSTQKVVDSLYCILEIVTYQYSIFLWISTFLWLYNIPIYRSIMIYLTSFILMDTGLFPILLLQVMLQWLTLYLGHFMC